MSAQISTLNNTGSGNGTTKAFALPVISVIIPALNEEKLIGRTLACFPKSVRERYGIEVIVSDGGSTDRTLEIARELADVVVEHNEERRQTIAEGRNCGAAHARGALLVFICADTVLAQPDCFLESLVNLLADGRNAKIVAIACPVKIAEEERRLSDKLFYTFFNNYVHFLNLIGLGMGRGECQIVRRDDFESVGRYNDAMVAGEDFDLYRRLHRRGRIAYNTALTVYESPRRFRRYGYLRVLAQWTANAISVMLFKRAVSREWEQIR